MRILIAEDDVVQLYMLENMVREWGHDVVTARDGLQALNTVQSEVPPNLAILDWRMPGMDGVEVCQRLRQESRLGPIYIIMFTVKDRKKDLVAGLDAGADDYLTKPVHRELLQARVQVGVYLIEARQLEEQLLRSQKMASLGHLTADLVHDFQNLLTPIRGYAQLAQKVVNRDNSVHQYLQQIENAAISASNLTRHMLDFSRSGATPAKAVNLNHTMLQVEMMLRGLVFDGIDLVVRPEPGLGLVEVSGGYMEQVLVNLAANARDAMPTGGELTIETQNVVVEASESDQHSEILPGEYVVLRVRDTGIGMSDEVKAHIFEPFFTTKVEGKGTGLGLTTCHRLVSQCGGYITVESAPGKGTTFEIYLPRVDRRSVPKPIAQTHQG